MKAILYIGHGTRSGKGAMEARGFIEKVKEEVSAPIQELCFLELTQPSIEEGFKRCIERGAAEITVVPLFLLAAGHIKHDIPEALLPLMEKHPGIPVKTANPFGVQPEIMDAIAELVSDAAGEVTADDSLLIVGRGSSDPGVHEDFAAIIKGLGERLPARDIQVCYLAAASPRFPEAMLKTDSAKRTIVIPYLLFPGLLLAEVDAEVKKRQKSGQDILHTGILGRHDAIRNIVTARAEGRTTACSP
ncbi:sirohydrochlorin chelatase [Peribacillus sp. SCS-37]|uniref:sirohydrochlorin chelatase n=1 Tax=Paraperibacillus esterisolvens TaxID=3115296 RepID=UPI0039057C0E